MMRIMKNKSKAPLGASLVVASSIFYSSFGIWTKLIGNFLDGYTASAIRGLFILLMLVPVVTIQKKWEPLNLKQNWRYIAGIIIASLFIWGPFYYAILHAGVGISLAVNYAAIIVGTFFFGWLFAHERFTKDKAISTMLGFVGLILIFSPASSRIGWLALAAAVISGVSAGANTVFAKEIKYNATQSIIALWTASSIANITMSLFVGKNIPFGGHMQWIYVGLFAVASLIASLCFVRGIKLIEAGAAGILGLLEIVFGVLFGVVFFHEKPGFVVLVGVAVIIASAVIPYLKDYNAKRGTLD
ncbi:MAG: hypothetical protein JWO47_932 [Candidatus Saccharibacteria bacterium]|nr:hypothetical protein [Candidatus Saccharibacteria bacterium]